MNFDAPEGGILIGRSQEADLRIQEPSVSRQHARLSQGKEGHWEIVDLESNRGTFVNNVNIRKKTLRDGDLVRFGGSTPYLFKDGQLVEKPRAVGISLDFKSISVSFDGKRILSGVDTSIQADEFVAIIGPSGCGKTTLLSVLTGAVTPEDGRVIWDATRDLAGTREEFQNEVGVVPQEVQLFEELTVAENLEYAARIRCSEATPDERAQSIQSALEWVELEEHRDKPVLPLSGGQRRRVNVAVELLRHPRLLLLDEPTAGLDPDLEWGLLDKLRGLSRRGMTVVCVIHSRNLDPFDRVIALRTDPSPERPSVIHSGTPHDSRIELKTSPKETESGKSRSSHATHRAGLALREEPQTDRTQRLAAVVAERGLLCFARDRQSMLLSVLLPVLVGVLIVISQSRQSDPAHLCFFLVITAFWLGANAGVREIVRDRSLYLRDRLAGLPPLAFLFGKAAAGLLVVSAQCLLLFVVSVVLVAILHSSAGDPLQHVCYTTGFFQLVVLAISLLITGFAGLMAGLGLSTFAKTERGAVGGLPLILLPQILLSRVAYGDAGKALDVAPFGVVSSLPSGDWIDWLVYLGSLGFIVRPGSMTMTMAIEGGPSTAGTMVEWLYLLALTAVYGLLLVVLFLEMEKRWSERS